MNIKDGILLYIKGLLIGAIDVVPGISGGTVAFIVGIYERLLYAIKSITPNLKYLLKGKLKTFWRNIDGTFLLVLVLGIITSLFTLAHVVTYLLDTQPILLWSFFFGLILASVLFIGKDVSWNWKTILGFLILMVVGFIMTSPENAPISSDNTYWYIFFCGAIAICALLLPGISGSFVLVLLGQYYFILEAVKTLNIPVLLFFGGGAIIGMLSFSHVLSWLFKHFKMIMTASMTGFILGSLNKIWPWKETITTYVDSHGIAKPLTERNITPSQFESITGTDNQLLGSIVCMIAGLSIIFVIQYIASKLKKAN